MMNASIMMLAAVFFPILLGIVLLLVPEISSRKRLLGITGAGLVITASLALLSLRSGGTGVRLFNFGDKLEI